MRTRLCSFHCPHQEEEDEAALAASWRKGNWQRRWELRVSAGLASFRIGGGLGLSLLILLYIYIIYACMNVFITYWSYCYHNHWIVRIPVCPLVSSQVEEIGGHFVTGPFRPKSWDRGRKCDEDCGKAAKTAKPAAAPKKSKSKILGFIIENIYECNIYIYINVCIYIYIIETLCYNPWIMPFWACRCYNYMCCYMLLFYSDV